MADRDILPDHFKPAHYDLTISNLDFKEWKYDGKVIIEGELLKPTKDIVLNTLELDLAKATLSLSQAKSGQSWPTDKFTADANTQRTIITFSEEIPASAKAFVTIEFSGKLNHDMAGFYRSQYRPATPAAASVPRDDEFHYMFSTQFESCDARRAFPCFDEPNLKASFDFAIEIPDDQVALSNMPVKSTEDAGSGKKLVTFERTPVMSTYLLAWAVGDFEYIEAFTERRYNGKQLPVRLYTTRGLVEQGKWALEHAPKIIDYFSEQFEIDYPLPKSDILAAHEFTHGAMENWGLVTYRMTAILFDEKASDPWFRNRIAYVVAHELAHQWFGNLVTMDWWDELWLNEGFATWAGWLATDHLHPDWQVWAQWVNEGMEDAFGLDSVRASHPIQVAVRDALEVNQIFDKISYTKGCSMIRMLASHLGVKTFLKGVAIYLRKHAYGNAKTEALWSALSEASGQDVNAVMGPWIEKIGYPVLRVDESTPGQIEIKQQRFLRTGDVKPEDDETTWWLPLAPEGKAGTKDVESISLNKKGPETLVIDPEFYVLNSGASGFYRVQYPPKRLETLGGQLDKLSTEDKIFITSSTAALAFSGDASTSSLLSFVKGFGGETQFRVLSQVLDSLGTIKSIFGDDEFIKKSLEKFTLTIIQKPLKDVGLEPVKGEDYNKSLLRKRLVRTAIASGDEERVSQWIINEASARFFAYFADRTKSPIHGDLRGAIYRAAIRTDQVRAVEILKKEWYTTQIIGGKDVCLQTLGHASDPALIKDAILPFLFNKSPPAPAADSVDVGDMHILAAHLASNRVARPLLWAFLRDNWAAVTAKVGNPIVLDRLVRVSLDKFADLDTLAEIEAFFADPDVDTKAFDRTLAQVKDTIRARAAYRARDAEGVRRWFAENGYAEE